MFKKILIPLDGSEMAERALPLALQLAEQDGAEVTLLRAPVVTQVFIPAEGGYGLLYPEGSFGNAREEAQTYLTGAQQLWARPSVAIHTAVAEGEAPSAIVDWASRWEADLIVMSSHGYSGFTRWVLGSVAERVLHAAPCPVFILRAAETPRHLLIPLDGSGLAEQVLASAGEVAHSLHASVELVRVVPEVSAGEFAELDEYERGLGRRLQQEVQEDAENYLKQIAAERLPSDLTVSWVVLHGQPAPALLHYVEKHPVDMVAMATHGHTGLRRWLYGSVTEKLLRSLHGNMLVVRPATRQLN